MEPFINYFRDKKIHDVLDVGTGKGGFIHVLQDTFPEAEITGIDPESAYLQIARDKYPDVSFIKMHSEKLLFRDNTFDVAVISMALHHLPKVKKSLKEMKRVVKDEGWIIVNEMISNNLNSAQEVHKLYHHFRSRVDMMTGIYHRKSFTKEAILQMLREADIPIQFFFEYKKNVNVVENKNELDNLIKKMKEVLERIRERPEYDLMKPEIEIFRKKAAKYGFQPATNLVIVGRKKSLS